MSQIAVGILLAAGLIAAVWTMILMGRQRQAVYSILAALGGVVCLVGLVSIWPGAFNSGIPVPLLKPSASPPASDYPRFSQFDPRTYKGPTGKIVVPTWKTANLTLMREGGSSESEILSVKTSDGTFTVPTGKYTVISLSQTVKDGAAGWTLSSSYEKPVSVSRGSVVRLNAGQQLVASVKVVESGRGRVNMDLQIVGRGGESCSISEIGSSKAPGFQVLSKQGKVLWNGKFEAG
jgi:hypothetical protein